MQYKITTYDEEETIELAQNIESEKFANMVICLEGDLGSGKTVFAKAFAHSMGIDEVSSPTFSIIKEYLPEERLDIKIKVTGENTRLVVLKPHGEQYTSICEAIIW